MLGHEPGLYAPSEACSLLTPKERRMGARPVLYAHAYNTDGGSVDTGASYWDFVPERLGATLAAGDFAGPATFGVDAATDAMEACRVAVSGGGGRVGGGIANDKAVIYGGSMGTTAAMNYARRFPARVACVVAVLPVMDVEDVRANNRSNLAAPIEAAYGGLAGWNAARPTHNPIEFAASLAGVPMLLCYSTNDPIALAGFVASFAAAVGPSCTTLSMGAAGHTFFGLDLAAVAAFITPYL
jgi:dienelactone hydrolase